MSEEKNVEETKEKSTPLVTDGNETPEVKPEEVKSPEPGSIEYTKAVEERIGKVTGKVYAAEAERDLYKQRVDQLEAEKVKPAEQVQTPAFTEIEPEESTFEDNASYVKALASWQFRKEQVTHDANTAQQTVVNNRAKMEGDFHKKVSESDILKEHPDFYDKMRFVNLIPSLHEAVLTSEKGPELTLHLANNPEIMRELNTLSPLVAARKLGTIEAKLSGKVEKKTVTDAPDPLTPVNTNTSAVTEDNPKDIKDWMKKRKDRELAKIKQNVEGGKLGR